MYSSPALAERRRHEVENLGGTRTSSSPSALLLLLRHAVWVFGVFFNGARGSGRSGTCLPHLQHQPFHLLLSVFLTHTVPSARICPPHPRRTLLTITHRPPRLADLSLWGDYGAAALGLAHLARRDTPPTPRCDEDMGFVWETREVKAWSRGHPRLNPATSPKFSLWKRFCRITNKGFQLVSAVPSVKSARCSGTRRSSRRDMTWTWLIVLHRLTKPFFFLSARRASEKSFHCCSSREQKEFTPLFSGRLLAVSVQPDICVFTVKRFDHPEKMWAPHLPPLAPSIPTPPNWRKWFLNLWTVARGLVLCGSRDTICWWWIQLFFSADRFSEWREARWEFLIFFYLSPEAASPSRIWVTSPARMCATVNTRAVCCMCL